MPRLVEIHLGREHNTRINNEHREGAYYSGEDESLPTGRSMGRRGQPVGSSRHEANEEDAMPACRRTSRQLKTEDGTNQVETHNRRPRPNLDPSSNEPAPYPRSRRGESITAPESTINATETQYTRDRDAEAAPNPQLEQGRHSTHAAANRPTLPTPARISHNPGQLHLYIYSFGQYYGCPCPGLEPDVRLLTEIDCSHLYSQSRPY